MLLCDSVVMGGVVCMLFDVMCCVCGGFVCGFV